MQHLASLERRARIRTALWLLSAAATVAFALHLGTQSKPLALLLLVAFALTQLPSLLRQLRFRRLMRSGDLGKVLQAYHPTLARLPHPETLGPLMVAAALAAHGLVDRARRALDRAARGEAWEAALEHRWFVETLMETFDGDRAHAVILPYVRPVRIAGRVKTRPEHALHGTQVCGSCLALWFFSQPPRRPRPPSG